MRKLISLTICILFIGSVGFSQDSNQKDNVSDSIITTKDTVCNVNLKEQSIDTVSYFMDKDNMVNLNNNPNVGQVIIIEKTNDIDKYLNYIIPVLTLILGIGIERLIENCNRKKRITKSGKRWCAELQSLKEPIEKQTESLNDFIVKYDGNEFMIPNINIFPNLKGDNLKTLDKSDLLDYIESIENTDDNIKLFNQATGIISILDSIYNNIQEKTNDFLKQSSQLTGSFNRNLQEYNAQLTQLHPLQQDPNTQILSPDDYNTLWDLYKRNIVPHLEDGRMNPFELGSTFFIPIIELFGNYHTNPGIIPILNPIRGCMNDIRGLRMEKVYIRENLTQIIEWYGNLSENLDDILTKLKST